MKQKMNEDDPDDDDPDSLDDVGLTHTHTQVCGSAAAAHVQLPAAVKQNQALKSSQELK